MPLLSSEKKRQIITVLGYSWNNDNLFPQLSIDYPMDIISKIDELMARAAAAKQQKSETFGNIQLKKVDEIEFYALKDSNYLEEFDRLIDDSLNALSELLSIPLAYGHVLHMQYQ